LVEQSRVINIRDIKGPIARCRQAPTKELAGVKVRLCPARHCVVVHSLGCILTLLRSLLVWFDVMQDLHATMTEDGPNPVLHPLLVMESQVAGKYNVVDGDTRLFIYKTWFSKEVVETPCMVVDGSLPKTVVLAIQDKANKETQSTRRDSLADEIVRMQQAASLFKTQKQAVRYIVENKILDRPGKTSLSMGHLEVRVR
jgi:hypothetical protein